MNNLALQPMIPSEASAAAAAAAAALRQAKVPRADALLGAAAGSGAAAEDGGEEDSCWLCLGGEEEGLGRLVAPAAPSDWFARCPRVCHPGCLSRWQLHCAGRQEEKLCRFCGDALPDWRHVPPVGVGAEGATAPTPPASEAPPAYMRISYNGRSHKIRVRPGQEGTRQFIEDCRQLLKIPPHLEFDVVFHCKEPATQSDLRFRGLDAFDAAVYCASLANHAAAIQQQQQQTQALQRQPQQQLPPPAPCPLPPPPPPPRALVRATSEVADELARMAAAAADAIADAAGGGGDVMGGGGVYGRSTAMVTEEQEDEAAQQLAVSSGSPVGNGNGNGNVSRRSSRGHSRSRGHGRNRRQRRTDGVAAAAAAGRMYGASPSASDDSVAFDSDEGDGGSGGGGGGSGGGMGSLASFAAAAVGSVLGAFRRCGSWEGA